MNPPEFPKECSRVRQSPLRHCARPSARFGSPSPSNNQVLRLSWLSGAMSRIRPHSFGIAVSHIAALKGPDSTRISGCPSTFTSWPIFFEACVKHSSQTNAVSAESPFSRASAHETQMNSVSRPDPINHLTYLSHGWRQLRRCTQRGIPNGAFR